MSVEPGLNGPLGPPRVTPPGFESEEPTARRGVDRPRSGGGGERPADRPRRPRAPAAAPRAPSRRGRRRRPRRGRRVLRIVQRIELWSVLKVSLIFNTVMLGVVLGAVALLWGLANTTGLVDDLEGFLRDSGFTDFRFDGNRMFRRVSFVGAVAALVLTVFAVLTAALVNLISEVTGGIRFVVIEEIVDRPAPRRPAEPSGARPDGWRVPSDDG